MACVLSLWPLAWGGWPVARWATLGLVPYVTFIWMLNRHHIRASQISPAEHRGGHDERGKIDLQSLLAVQRAAVSSDNLGAVPGLIKMIVDPARYRIRTSETVSLEGRTMGQRVSMEFVLPPKYGTTFHRADDGDTDDAGPAAPDPAREATQSREMYVPALMVPKPTLIDHIVMVDGQGQAVSVLSHEETLELISVSLRFLLMFCSRTRVRTPAPVSVPAARAAQGRRGAALTTLEEPDQRERMQRAELLLLNLVHSIDPHPGPSVDDQIDDALNILELPAEARERLYVRWLRDFVRTLSHAYPVIAAMPRPEANRLTLVYERTMVPPLDIGWPRERLRLALGLRPLKVTFSTALALSSSTYHLRVDGPPSQYLMEQTITCSVCGGRLSRPGVECLPGTDPRHEQTHQRFADRSGPNRPHYELRSKRGQSFASLYMRGFATTGEHLRVAVSFGETPPGTLASALATASITCLLVGTIGYAESAGIGNGSDVPPLLLTLPAAAASWFGFTADGDSLLRSSLAARLSLITGAITSLMATALFLLTDHADPRAPEVFSVHIWHWWALLFGMATVNLLCIVPPLIVRSWSYRRLLLRKDTDDPHLENRTT